MPCHPRPQRFVQVVELRPPQVGPGAFQGLPDRLVESDGIDCAPDDQKLWRRVNTGLILQCPIENGLRYHLLAVITGVPDHTGNLVNNFRITFLRAEALPHRGFARPETPRSRLIDHYTARAFSPVAAIQPASLLQWNSQNP